MAFPDDELTITIKAYIGADPGDAPGTWPTPVDWSSRLIDKDILITRGRQSGTSTASSGSATFWLDDSDLDLATSDLTGTPVSIDASNIAPNTATVYPRFRGYIANVESEVIRGAGGHEIVTTKITLGGKLRQLTQGAVPRSALRRYYDLVSPSPTSYWAMEDGQFTTLGALTSGTGGAFESTSWGAAPVEPGTSELAPWIGTGLLLRAEEVDVRARLPLPSSPTRVTAEGTFLFRPASGAICAGFLTLTEVPVAGGFSTVGQVWIVDIEQLADGTRNIIVFGLQDGGVLVNETTATPTTTAPGPHHVRLDLVQDGADIDWTVYLDGAIIDSGTASSATLASFNYAQLIYTQTSGEITFGHIAVWHNTAPPSVTDVWAAVQGHAGETATERIARICDEENIPHTAATPTSDPAVGPQPIADVVAVMRDAETVGHGILGEDITTWGFTYRPLEDRYAQDAVMTIDLATYRVGQGAARNVLRPVRDDRRLRNEWTIRRPGGGEVTVRDEDSIAKRGRYNDSATVNVASDDQLLNEAAWRVHE